MSFKPTTYQATNLKNQLLIAMPSLNGSNFHQAVAYICEHTPKGAMGIVINKPSPMALGDILKQLNIEYDNDKIGNFPVLSGGPVAQEQGFLIHQKVADTTATDESDTGKAKETVVDPKNNIVISASRDLLREFAQGKGPHNLLITLGYAGWGSGQLEFELKDNRWLLAPANLDILFTVPYPERWKVAAKSIGVHFDRLSSLPGHG